MTDANGAGEPRDIIQAGRIVNRVNQSEEEDPFVEAEVIEDDAAGGEIEFPQFQNNFYGSGSPKIVQVKGEITINNLNDL